MLDVSIEGGKIVEDALASAPVLNDSQRDNVRAKVSDVREGRTVRESVPFRVILESNIPDIVAAPRNRPHVESPFDILHENSYIVELFRPDSCVSTSITVFVEWDGTVLPCFQHRIPLGNLNQQSFAELWNGEPMRRHRESFLTRELDPFCARCQAFFCNHA